MAEKGVGYILGIVSLVLAFFAPLAGIILGIIGLVQNKKEKGAFTKKAKILNILAIIFGAIFAAMVLAINYSTYAGLI